MRWDKRSGQGKRWRRRGQVYRLGWDDYKLGVLYERELGFPTLKNSVAYMRSSNMIKCLHLSFLAQCCVSLSETGRAGPLWQHSVGV